MKKLSFMLKLTLVIALVAVVGCQDRSNVMEPQVTNPTLGPLGLPGVTLDSARFSVYCTEVTNQPVTAHRVTSSWNEMTVTFNTFGGAFDPGVVGTFFADGMGWRSVDVTPLVQQWIDGVYPNFGILLDQNSGPLTDYVSSEFVNLVPRPYLKICFTTSEGSQCVTMQRGVNGTVYDTYVWQSLPDQNFGASENLYTGFINNLHKQSLFWFTLPEFPVLAAIGDFVWFDDNRDGIQDLGEPGVPGVTVHLMDCAGNILATDVTDADGLYLFSDLEPGDYNIHFVLPAGYFISPQDQGLNNAVDSDADVTTGLTICTTLEGGETDLTWDLGIYLPDEHCTRTIGYWKTHDGSGPQDDVVTPLLPIWLGTAAGAASIHVTNTTISHNILEQNVYGTPSNGITKLYAQLLGAKLNEANDADITLIAATIAAADAFLAIYDWNDWAGFSNAQKRIINGWATTLDNYNNGLIGPIHCD